MCGGMPFRAGRPMFEASPARRVPKAHAIRDVPLAWSETLLVVAAAFLYWNDLLRQIFPGVDNASIEFRLTHFVFYGAFLVALMQMPGLVGQTLRKVPLLVSVLALPMVSALWSISPGDTFQRSIAVTGSSLFGVYLACRVRPLEAFRLIGVAATVSAILSVVLIALVPSVGLMSEGEYVNVWSGAHLHKNGLGQMTALGAIICLVVMMTDGVRRTPLLALGLVLNLLLLAGSRSLTSQVVFVTGVGLLFTMGRFVRFIADYALITVPLAMIGLSFILFGLSADTLGDLLASAGKDATMSSRVPLWNLLGGFMEGHWWLGHGYEVFWSDASYAVRVIEGKLHFRPYYSHNGYLEIWLAFGFVGLAMIAGLIATLAVRTLRGLYHDARDPLLLLSFVYTLMFLLQNTAEATILQRNNMSWTLCVMLYIAVVRAVARDRRQVGVTAATKRLQVAKDGEPLRPRLPVL